MDGDALATNSTDSRSPTVLVVDDDTEVRGLLLRLLTENGYRCIGAVDGESALAMAGPTDIAAAVVDINLPGMNGAELAWRLHQASPALPIIAVSGYLRMWDPDDLADLGVLAAVDKPFDCEQLLATLERLITRAGTS